ncbi:hypothetical protein E4T56_gene6926 [Termitomyces sp. T112]|nr:hypothetical protein E4T56_gene6926 [Termitomyces sp. T112]
MTEVEYLGVVTPDSVRMDPAKVDAALNWPLPQNVKEDTPWDWDSKCQSIFLLLKRAFTSALVLHHFDPSLPIVLECNASNYAIAGILSQSDLGGKDLRPVAFYTRLMIPAELNYNIYNKELLAIIKAFCQWRAYLEGSLHCIQVYSDHNNLQYFTTMKQLSHHQARWSETLSEYDFTIHYHPGQLGMKPNALTRRSDVYPKKSFEAEQNAFNHRVVILPKHLHAVLILNEEGILQQIRNSPPDSFTQHDPLNNPEESSTGNPFLLSLDHRLLLRSGQIYAPDHKSICLDILWQHHNHKL